MSFNPLRTRLVIPPPGPLPSPTLELQLDAQLPPSLSKRMHTVMAVLPCLASPASELTDRSIAKTGVF